MHHIHHTHGFVIGSRNFGEANKMLTIYTREMGLVHAMVQGIRLGKSKLKSSLQDLSYAKIDFVQGRDIWRVTSATHIDSFPYARRNKDSLLLISRVSKLIERLCAGEEKNEKIFDDFVNALYLLDKEDTTSLAREALELYLVLSITHALGYIGDGHTMKDYIASDFDINAFDVFLKEKKQIISHINRALSESQL